MQKIQNKSREVVTLTYAVFVAGLCSIIYELLIATTVSYFEGDSVKYFSITIGIYMAALGLGAYMSKFVKDKLIEWLIVTETILGLIGGFSIPALYVAFSHTDAFTPIYVVLTSVIGLLIGLEIPFLTRLLEPYRTLRISIAQVLSLDYLGALLATMAFPLVLLPFLGVFRSSLFFGLLNMTIGLFLLCFFPDAVTRRFSKGFKLATLVIVLTIIAGIATSNRLLMAWNNSMYDGRIIFFRQTKYQTIVLNKYRDDIRLYLNGNLQFSSVDEYRYHETLVHPPLFFAEQMRKKDLKILLLGAGDGLAVREIIKHPSVSSITVVDLDPAIIDLAKTNPYLHALNRDSLNEPRVRIVIGDANGFLQKRENLYDVIIADLPDPNNTDLSRLYSREFFRLVRMNLISGGVFMTQATSPYYAKKAFWCINKTIALEFKNSVPLHTIVPSFGDWGFVMASDASINPTTLRPSPALNLRYLDTEIIGTLFVFPNDVKSEDIIPSTLDRPVVLEYYLKGWRHWGR